MNEFQFKLSIVEEINWENTKVISIDIETINSAAIIIIYEDEYIYFDYLNKNDDKLINENWSEKFETIDDLLQKIDNFMKCKIRKI